MEVIVQKPSRARTKDASEEKAENKTKIEKYSLTYCDDIEGLLDQWRIFTDGSGGPLKIEFIVVFIGLEQSQLIVGGLFSS